MSSIPLLDLKAQFAPLRDEIRTAIDEIVESQRFILGPVVEQFEEQIAGYVGAAHAVGCASGTDALILALAGLEIGPGDHVVTTPFSFFSTASCAYKVGARPVFVDIDPDSFNLNPELVERAIGPKTRAILPVHLFGRSCEMEPLLEIAERRSLAIVEDAAQALGATYDSTALGRTAHCGTMGRAGCYSFFPSKNLGGFGDGGMIVTDDAELADRLRLLRVHGGRQMYHHQWIGWNSRLDALQAAVLRVKLPHLDTWSGGRASNASRYDELFAASGMVDAGHVRVPARGQNSTHIYNQYTLRVRQRDGLKQHLDNLGIGNSIYYPKPLHLQPCFHELGYREGDFPASESASREVLSLPVFPELAPEKLERIVDAIARFYADA